MVRDLLSNRWFQVGFVFILLIIGGSLLYSWHIQRTTEREMERHDRFVAGQEKQNETSPVETVKVQPDRETPGFVFTPEKNTDTSMSDKTEALPNETENLEPADVSETAETISEEAPAEDVPVSPFGFGPYPEVPADYPFNVNWNVPEQVELLTRVMIKSWTEGDRFIGGNIVNGKVLLNFPNTVYVRYKEIQGPDGSGERIRSVVGGANIKTPAQGEDFPQGVRVLDYDLEALDPYEYLNLN